MRRYTLKKESVIIDVTFCKNYINYFKSIVVLAKNNDKDSVILHHIVPLDVRGHFFFIDEIMTKTIEEISIACFTCNTLRTYYDIVSNTKVVYVHFVLMPPDAVYDAARYTASISNKGVANPLTILNKIANSTKFKLLLNSEYLRDLIEKFTNIKLFFSIHILLGNLYFVKRRRKSLRDIVIYRRVI